MFLKQQYQKLSKHVTLPDESSDKLPIMEVGKWKPGKKLRLFICGHTGVGKTTFANTLKEVLYFSKMHITMVFPSCIITA